MKKILLATFLMALSSCASQKMIKYVIETDPPEASIDVNGMNYCQRTPCEIKLQCSKHWVGMAYSSSGYAGSSIYTVQAMPNGPNAHFSQTRVIDACQVADEDNGGRIFMNLNLERINPRNTVDVNVRNR